MGEYTQTARPMRVDTPLPSDTLLLEAFEAEEGLSRPFLYTLELLSEKPDIAPKDLLREHMLVSIVTQEGKDPFLTHGFVRSFVQLGKSEELHRYRAEVVPAFWFLTQTADCRIFQNKTVVEIVEEVLGEADPKVTFDTRCTRSYPKREYCVQYRESDFNFVSRLLEQEGIFYFFEHSDSDHTLVMSDAHTTFKPCPGYETMRMDPHALPGDEVVRSFVKEHAVRSYEVMLMDYDPLQPSLQLFGTMRGSEIKMDPVFDYPGLFTDRDAGEYLARVELERREKLRERVSGTSSGRGLRSGGIIELAEHFRADANARYYLDRVRHSGHSGAFRAWGEAGFHYANEFTAYPDDVPFRPDRNARQPLVHGTQTALVVGKKGEEVWVDEHGRIKVQFHWDKYGKKDENSSCWIRVSTQTAGKNWGHIEIPRIGHEVIVDFLEGNPDRPIVVGSVYNAEMKTPYPLPDDQVVSGIKTKSSPKASGYNEFIMDDKAGKELIRMHAQKDLESKILNDETRIVGNHQTLTVEKGDQKITLEDGDQTIILEKGDQTLDIQKGKQTITVEKHRVLTVTKGDQKTTVKSGDIIVKADMGSITIKAMKEILLKCGPSTIKLSPAGIEMKGPTLKAEGQTTAEIKGGISAKVEGGVSGEFKGGAMAKLQGGAMAQIQGGIVKIN